MDVEALVRRVICTFTAETCDPGGPEAPDGLSLLLASALIAFIVPLIISAWKSRIGGFLKSNLLALTVATLLVVFYLLDPQPILLLLAILPLAGCLLFGGVLDGRKFPSERYPVMRLNRAVALSGLVIYGIGYGGLWVSDGTTARNTGSSAFVVTFLRPTEHENPSSGAGNSDQVVKKVFLEIKRVLVDMLSPVEQIEIEPQLLAAQEYDKFSGKYAELPWDDLAEKLERERQSIHYAVQNYINIMPMTETNDRLQVVAELRSFDPDKTKFRRVGFGQIRTQGDSERIREMALVIGYYVAHFLLNATEMLAASDAEKADVWREFSHEFKSRARAAGAPSAEVASSLSDEARSVLLGEETCSTSGCVAELAAVFEAPPEDDAAAVAQVALETAAKAISIAGSPQADEAGDDTP